MEHGSTVCIVTSLAAGISHGCAFGASFYRRKFDTADLALAKRRLRTFKDDLERTDATKGNSSFAAVLEAYEGTLTGADSTFKDKRTIIAKLKQTWFGVDTLPLRTVKPSDVKQWLSEYYGKKSASYYNSALTVVRAAFNVA